MKHKVWVSGEKKMEPANTGSGFWKPGMIFHLRNCECGQGDRWKLAADDKLRTTEMDPEDFIAALLLDKIVPFVGNDKWQTPGGKWK